MAETEIELDSLAVYPVLHAGDIDAFLRLNRRYFVLLNHPDGVTGEARWNVLNQIALNFRSLDFWLSQGKPLPEAWAERSAEIDEGMAGSEETEPEARDSARKRSTGHKEGQK